MKDKMYLPSGHGTILKLGGKSEKVSIEVCVCMCLWGGLTEKERSSLALSQVDMYYLMCHPKTNSECLNPA